MEPVDSVDAELERKRSSARAVLRNGSMPTDFSFTLGAAPCNHTCLFCPQSVEKPKRAQWIDLDILKKVLGEMPEENLQINVSSYSETLAAPVLLPAIRLMKSIRPKLRVILASNGTLFRESVMSELMDLGLDFYSYSFDAATRKDYKTLMQKDDFLTVWRNLEKLVQLRQQKKSNMTLQTHIMHFQGVEEDFEIFREYWQDKLDGIVLRRVGNWGSDDLGLVKQLETKGYVSAHKTPERRFPCNSIFMHFKLQYDGGYFPCVAAVPALATHVVPPLGHARDITWSEAWARLGEMRQAHLEGRWDEYACCRSCNVWSLWDDMWFEKSDDSQPRFHLDEGVEHAAGPASPQAPSGACQAGTEPEEKKKKDN